MIFTKFFSTVFILLFAASAKTEVSDIIFAKYIYEININQQQNVYLFGSSHLISSKIPIRLGQCVKNIIAKSDNIYIESDFLANRLASLQTRKTVRMDIVMNHIDDSTVNYLTDVMFNEQTEENKNRLKSFDANFVAAFLGAKLHSTSRLFDVMDYGLDNEIEMAARFLNKKIDYIETPEDQFYFLKITPPTVYASSITYLLKMIENEAEANRYFNDYIEIMQASAEGNGEKIASMLKKVEFADSTKYIITGRNESVTDKILSKLSKSEGKNIFVALGAAHLAGEGSVVQLLKAKGFTATRLCQ